jgi:beta-glucosidase-like glycosyl hydrolase/CubicO group peptidase (beta-lactamase class C family)
MKRIILASLLFACPVFAVAQPVFLKNPSVWADSIASKMTLDEAIGQLFMVAAYSNPKLNNKNQLLYLIKNHKIGGVIFMKGSPVLQAKLYNELQSQSQIPLWAGIDGEWGLAMRLDSTISYPKALALGAVQNYALIEKMGEQIAQQVKRVGVHINFAPLVDINSNPKNPVIGYRSLGEQKEQVTLKALAYMQGMQNYGVLASAKHFPGHGDTQHDSHKTLPIVQKSAEKIDSMELYPYRELIAEGLGSVMVGHLSVPSMGDDLPASISGKIIHEKLKKSMGFEGIILSDALNMGAVNKLFPQGELEVKALLAGNDVLLFSESVSKAQKAILQALHEGKISEKDIRDKAKKILYAKAFANLQKDKYVAEQNIAEDLQKPAYLALQRELTAASFTLVKNQGNLLPLNIRKTKQFAAIVLGENQSVFGEILQKMQKMKVFYLGKNPTEKEIIEAIKGIEKVEGVVLSIHKMNQNPDKKYGLPQNTDFLLRKLGEKYDHIALNLLGNPYALDELSNASLAKSILIGYEDNALTQEMSAQILLGAMRPEGKLPVSTKFFKVGLGLNYPSVIRLSYGLPEEVGMNSRKMLQIDSLVNLAIQGKATPGCRILVARHGKIIFDKSYGNQTYSSAYPIKTNTIYDVASLTKIMGSTLALMRLQSEKRLGIEDSIGRFLPELDGNRYAGLTIRNIASHQAGLEAYIPFYKNTLVEKKSFSRDIYNQDSIIDYPFQVAEKMYMRANYMDTIFKRILDAPLKDKQSYKYSDLGFFWIKWVIERITQKNLEDYVAKNLYQPLALDYIGFLPLKRFKKEQIAPTEIDNYFRFQTLQGYVHDQGAAMLGGVGGHAGLFSTAYDLAVIMQLFLNKGTYGEVKLFEPEIMDLFLAPQNEKNRRGIGFDRQDKEQKTVASEASINSFGHTGFTGTMVWADPDFDLIYVFLSNRTYPSAENKKLIKLNTRNAIQSVIYQAIQAS